MDRTAIDRALDTALAVDPEALGPASVLFLLREYLASGAERLRGAIEIGLTRGLSGSLTEPDPCTRMQWLQLLAESIVLSDDERIRDTVQRALPPALDALESRVRHAYEPGEGLIDFSCVQHLQYADALLTGFDLSGRLPYAMLAEELLRHARRRWWRNDRAWYDAGFDANCAALQVLCRLARLHDDAAYRESVAPAPDRFFADDARRLASALDGRAGEHTHEAGAFGAAMLDWFALESNLQ